MIYNWSFCILFGKAGMDHIHVYIYMCVWWERSYQLLKIQTLWHYTVHKHMQCKFTRGWYTPNLLNLNQVDNYIVFKLIKKDNLF